MNSEAVAIRLLIREAPISRVYPSIGLKMLSLFTDNQDQSDSVIYIKYPPDPPSRPSLKSLYDTCVTSLSSILHQAILNHHLRSVDPFHHHAVVLKEPCCPVEVELNHYFSRLDSVLETKTKVLQAIWTILPDFPPETNSFSKLSYQCWMAGFRILFERNMKELRVPSLSTQIANHLYMLMQDEHDLYQAGQDPQMENRYMDRVQELDYINKRNHQFITAMLDHLTTFPRATWPLDALEIKCGRGFKMDTQKLAKLMPKFNNLRDLFLGVCSNDLILDSVGRHCPSLCSLTVSGNEVTNYGISHLCWQHQHLPAPQEPGRCYEDQMKRYAHFNPCEGPLYSCS